MNAAASNEFRGELRFDEPMSKHTSWRLGGPAERYYVPADLLDLQNFLAAMTADMPLLWVGLGSNLLVRDGGIAGQVIAPFGGIKTLREEADRSVYAECGVSCAKLARFCQQHSLGDADFFAGIPGTVGGALAMNAGAFGGETWQTVKSLTMINRKGVLIERGVDEFEVGYREVKMPVDEWFVAARFHFVDRELIDSSNIRQLLQQRNKSQPIGQPSCGSVFRNPPGGYAAELIEKAGLKGYSIGSALVSEKHANFIISDESTKASDVEALIEYVQASVAQKFKVQLQREVRIVGEA